MSTTTPVALLFFRVIAEPSGRPAALLLDVGAGDEALLAAELAAADGDKDEHGLSSLQDAMPGFYRAERIADPALQQVLRAAGWQPLAPGTLCRVDQRLVAGFLPAGTEWVDGNWCMAPPSTATGAQAASNVTALQMVQLVARDADTHEIEALLRRDPTLSYNLLRLVNSLGVGGGRRITSFSQALLLLGRQQLRRWLNLMLFAARQGDVRSAMLLARVAMRARALELLAKAAGLDKTTQEQAFMTGMFSLLGVLFGMPLAEVLAPLALGEAVMAALLQRTANWARCWPWSKRRNWEIWMAWRPGSNNCRLPAAISIKPSVTPPAGCRAPCAKARPPMAETGLARCLRLARLARALAPREGEQGMTAPDPARFAPPGLDATLAELEAALAALSSSTPALAELAAATPDLADPPLISLDLAGFVTDWNGAAAALFGYSRAEAVGQHAFFLDADDSEAGPELFPAPDGAVVEVLRRTKGGDTIRVAMSTAMLHDEEGEPAGILVKLAPAALSWQAATLPRAGEASAVLSASDQQRLHARIIEDSEQGVLITDAEERIVSLNAAFSRITGYTAAELIGSTPDILRSGVHDAEFRAAVRASILGQGTWRGEITGKRKNGELFPQSVSISVVRDTAGAITHTFSLFSDISVHKDFETRMQRMANYDSLTGLPNRSLFHHLVDQMLSEARRATEYGAVLVVELDRLGAVSDSLGHDVAAQVLAETGRRFRGALRDADM